jgi:hypothetical protein
MLSFRLCFTNTSQIKAVVPSRFRWIFSTGGNRNNHSVLRRPTENYNQHRHRRPLYSHVSVSILAKACSSQRWIWCHGWKIGEFRFCRWNSTQQLDSSTAGNENSEGSNESTPVSGIEVTDARNDSHSSLPPNTSKRIAWIVWDAEKLLNKEIGTLQYPDDYDGARRVINAMMHDVNDVSFCSPAVNITIRLLERCVREYALLLASQQHVDQSNALPSSSNEQLLWFCNPSFYNGLFNRWKVAALLNESGVIPPRELVVKLQTMSSTLPDTFRYDITTMTIIMQAIVQVEPPSNAPIVAERLLDFIQIQSKLDDNDALKPDVHVYCLVLQAWSESGLSNASQKMEQIMDHIQHVYSQYNPSMVEEISLVPYKIWIRYWARIGNVKKVEGIFHTIERDERLQPQLDTVIMSEVVSCYTKVGQIMQAEDMFDKIISLGKPPVETDNQEFASSIRAIVVSAHCLMNWYRRSINMMIDKNQRKPVESITNKIQETIERAERVVSQVEAFPDIDIVSLGKLECIWIFVTGCRQHD